MRGGTLTISPSERFFFSRLSGVEVWFAIALFIFLLILRILYAFHYRIDSDEPQHLHVVWGWTQGMIPYRDYFDNHSPLFQMLCAPLFAALGTRADIIIPMRLAMFPLFALSIFFVGRIAGTLELVSFPPFIIVYRIKSETVEILRIYHGAQDWP